MKLKVRQRNGVLTVSTLGLPPGQALMLWEEEGGFVLEVQEREVAPVAVAPPAPVNNVNLPNNVSLSNNVSYINPVSEQEEAPAAPFDTVLFKKLSALRKQLAIEKNVPPYVIFHDKALRAMVETLPEGFEAFGSIEGVGQTKLEKYGEQFLAVIHEHVGVAV